MLLTMSNLCTIALLYDVRTPTEQFKRKIVGKKLTLPVMSHLRPPEALAVNYRP